MSAGNLNTDGNKKNNFPYQFKVLQLLGAISGTSGAGATEATLQLVLSAIQQGQDFEAKIVVDDNGNGTTYLEVRIWNPDTQTWETPLYYLPGSNTGVPAGSLTAPIIYINNGAVLAQIYTELLDQGLTLDGIKLDTANLDVALSTRATEATQLTLATEAKLEAVRVLLAAIDSTVATETTLLLVKGVLDTIDADTSALATPTIGLGVSMLRVTVAGAGSVTAGRRRVSFFNAGNADSTVAGTTLKKGEAVSFSADGLRDTLAAISYNCLTSELLITTVG
jgi:hypothetical protein